MGIGRLPRGSRVWAHSRLEIQFSRSEGCNHLYFTILTNLIVAVTMTRVAQGRWPGGTLPDVPAITGVVLTIAIACVSDDLLLSGRVPAMGPSTPARSATRRRSRTR